MVFLRLPAAALDTPGSDIDVDVFRKESNRSPESDASQPPAGHVELEFPL